MEKDILTVFVESIYRNGNINYSNIFFSAIILALLAFGFFCKESKSRKIMPYLCASIGVFGTFFGIFIGIGRFDFYDINNSLSSLLDGMKTAFFTSLVGMSASMILKAVYAFMSDRFADGPQTDDILQEMSDTISSIDNELASNHQSTQAIFKRIEASTKNTAQLGDVFTKLFTSQEDECSLVSQISLIRKEITENHKKTQEVFQNMMENFSNTASKSLVEQMGKVIDKFNIMLTDLVAESFKELKDSTIRLNQWQEEYKKTIENVYKNISDIFVEIDNQKDIFKNSCEKIDSLATQFESIDRNLSNMANSGKELDCLAENIRHQNDMLATSLEAINGAGERARAVIPQISDRMDKIINQIEISSQAFTEILATFMENMKDNFSYQYASLRDNINEQQETINEFLDKSTSMNMANVAKASKMVESEAKNITSISNDFSRQIGESIRLHQSKTAELLNKVEAQSLQSIERVKDTVISASESLLDSSDAVSQRVLGATEEQQRRIVDFVKDAVAIGTDHIGNAHAAIAKATGELKESMQGFAGNIRTAVEEQQNSIAAFVKDAATENQNHVAGMHEGMQAALSRAMGEFANGVGQVSLRFTTDYSALVDKLKEFVKGMGEVAKLQEILNSSIREIHGLEKSLGKDEA